MQVRHAHVIQEDARLHDVALQFLVSDCDLMVVTDGCGRLKGVISESCVVRLLLSNPPESATVASIVTHHAEAVRMNAELTAVLPLFRSSANTAVAVVDDAGVVRGILLRRDVIAALLQRRIDGASGTERGDSSCQSFSGSGRATVVKSPTNSLLSASPVTRERAPELESRSRPAEAVDQPQTFAAQSSSGPHFLRGDAARRVLWAAEDRL
jgi:hypothetical protein